MREAKEEPAEFRKTPHATNARIAGRDAFRLGEVIHHDVPVIRTERELAVRSTLCAAAGLLGENFTRDGGHVDGTGEMICLVEGAVRHALRAP